MASGQSYLHRVQAKDSCVMEQAMAADPAQLGPLVAVFFLIYTLLKQAVVRGGQGLPAPVHAAPPRINLPRPGQQDPETGAGASLLAATETAC